MSRLSLAGRLVVACSVLLSAAGLAHGDSTLAILPGIVIFFMLLATRAENWALREQHRRKVLEARNAQLEAQDLWRQLEYDRLVAEANAKIGQARMVINGTRR